MVPVAEVFKLHEQTIKFLGMASFKLASFLVSKPGSVEMVGLFNFELGLMVE